MRVIAPLGRVHRSRVGLRGLFVAVLPVLGTWLAACDESTPTSPHSADNRAPVAVAQIPAVSWLDPYLVDIGGPYASRIDVAVWPYFRDPDGESLEFMATTDNAGLQVAVSEGFVRLAGWNFGLATVSVFATDPHGLTASQSFRTVSPGIGTPPLVNPLTLRAVGPIPSTQVILGEKRTVDLNEYFRGGRDVTVTASTPSSETVSVSVSGHRLILEGNAVGGPVVVTVTLTAAPLLRWTSVQMVEQEFEVIVDPATTRRNTAPRFLAPPHMKIVPQGTRFSFDMSPHFEDPDGDAITFAAAAAVPVSATVHGSRLTLEGGTFPGFANIVMRATDPGALSAIGSFRVRVTGRVGGG